MIAVICLDPAYIAPMILMFAGHQGNVAALVAQQENITQVLVGKPGGILPGMMLRRN